MNRGDMTYRAATQTLGRYHLKQLIGRGGMGEVWLGEDPRLHRQVAIKTLPTRSQHDREFLLRFEREAQAAAALNHPHILPVYDYGDQLLSNGQSITYIVMPYIPDGNLSNIVSAYHTNNTLMPPQEAFNYLMQAAEAIDYAHEQGVTHRDIKPGNMLMRGDKWLLLADFGIARIVSSSEHLTQTGIGFGTPEYMAPEQAQGKAEHASDNYSLAVIAYHLFTGRLPFKAETGYATTIQHLTMQPPSPRQLNPALSLATEMILLRGLAKQPTDRLPSACLFVSELQHSLGNSTFQTLPRQSFSSGTGKEPSTTGTALASATTEYQTDAGISTDSQTKKANTGLTRRQLIIGGATTLVALVAATGAIGTLAFFSKAGSPPTQTMRPTADPDAPTIVLHGHNSPTRSLAWLPQKDALILASAGKSDSLVFLWDIQKLPQQSSPTQNYLARQSFDYAGEILLAWSPDGKFLALGNAGKTSDIFNTAALTIYTSDLNGPVPGFESAIAITGANFMTGLSWFQNKYVVTANDIISANLNAPSQFQLGMVDITQPHQPWIATSVSGSLAIGGIIYTFPLSVSPDGSSLAVATQDGAIIGQLAITGTTLNWLPQTNPLKISNNDVSNEIEAVTWSSNGQTVGGFPEETTSGQFVFWHWQDKNPSPSLLSISEPVTTISWTPAPASSLLAAGTKEGTVLLWDLANKNTLPIRTLNSGGINAAVGTLAWSPDGTWLAAGLQDNYGSILLWKTS